MNDRNIRISVIVPCYNVEAYVEECLDSVLAQTFPADDTEIILVNDASTDHTLSILKAYEEKHPDRILLVDCPVNRGLGAARNTGMRYAAGEYTMFLDSDDSLHPDILRELYEKAVAFDCDIVRSGYRMFKGDNITESEVVFPDRLYEPGKGIEERKKILLEHGYRYGNLANAKLYRSVFLKENNMVFPEGIRMEDIGFHQEGLLRARRYYACGRALYNYRINPKGIMLSPEVTQYFMDVFYVQEASYRALKEEGLCEGLEAEYGLVFYVKGFVMPMEYMIYGGDAFPYDPEKVSLMSNTLMDFFPDILHNPYVLSDHSEENIKMLGILRDTAKKHPNNKVRVDILLLSGGHGGFENVLRDTALYLGKFGCLVRFIQIVPSEIRWYPEEAEYVCLEQNPKNLDFDMASVAYAGQIAHTAVPDLILAAGWPYVVSVAEEAVANAGYAVPVCAWPHGDIRFYEESGSGGMEHILHADLVFAINNKIAEDIYREAPQKPVYRIKNSYDPDRVRYSEERNTHKIAYVGRLSHEKAVAVILYAMEAASETWELYIAGSGDGENELRRLTKELGLSGRVHFSGWQEDPWKNLTDCRALVMTSLYEGAPLSVLEALASGMQVISTPCGNVPELIEDGKTGFLYPFANPEALADVLKRMGRIPFTPETARECRESVKDYVPDKVMKDMAYKVIASARRIILPQQFAPGKTDLYFEDKKQD